MAENRTAENSTAERSLAFEHTTLGQRILFGTGHAATHLEVEIARLGARRVMVIASARDRSEVERITAGLTITLIYDDIAPHVPIDKAEKARTAAINNQIDLLVSIGGGSTTGLAKAIAMTTGLPIIAVPTTYAGSEATNMWGITETSRKVTGIDDRVLPITVIYDAALTMSLPRDLSVSSGLNALAHSIDSMWAPRTDPINQALALEGIRALNDSLPLIRANPNDVSSRERALYGAYMAAVAFASAGSGMHHKICHVLGGRWDLPHAATHAVVLPHVLAFNAPAIPDIANRIALAFGAENALAGLTALGTTLGAPTALGDLGLAKQDIKEAVQLILPAIPESNPRHVTEEDLTALLAAAHAGR